MDPVLVGTMGFLLLIVLVFLGVPVGISMIIPASAGLFYLVGFDAACKLFTLHTFRFASSYDFGAVPLFLMMGYMAMYAGLTGSAYDSARVWLNRLPGGLAMATCVASGFFGACCGSGIPAMAAFSRIAIPEMLRHKYDKGLASGTVASSATLAVLIPPSIIMVIYALLTEVSLGKMLLAGYLPGALSIVIYMAMIGIRVHFNPRLAPSSGETFTWRQHLAAFKGIWGIFVLFAILMGGIYTGFFTATEAAAGGALAAFVIMVLTGKFNRSNFLQSLSETLVINAMTFLMMAGAAIFTVFMEVSNLPAFVTTWVINHESLPVHVPHRGGRSVPVSGLLPALGGHDPDHHARAPARADQAQDRPDLVRDHRRENGGGGRHTLRRSGCPFMSSRGWWATPFPCPRSSEASGGSSWWKC